MAKLNFQRVCELSAMKLSTAEPFCNRGGRNISQTLWYS